MNRLLPAFVVLACWLLSSCMTIFTGDTVALTLSSVVDEPVSIATCEQVYDSVRLPARIEVKKRYLNLPIRLSSDNYVFSPLYPGRRANEWSWLAACYTEGISAIVDLSTGAWYKPVQQQYFVPAIHRDSLALRRDTLPAADYRMPSVLKPHGMRFYRHELRLMGGLGPYVENSSFRQRRGEVYSGIMLGPTHDVDCGFDVSGGFSVEYFYHLDERWALGLAVGSAVSSEALCDEKFEFDPEAVTLQDGKLGTMRTTATYLLSALKFNWLFFNGGSFYSKAALGLSRQHVWFTGNHPHVHYAIDESPYYTYTYSRDYDNRFWRLEGQCTFVGIESGRAPLRFFAELGWGLQGVFNVGLSYNLGRFH